MTPDRRHRSDAVYGVRLMTDNENSKAQLAWRDDAIRGLQERERHLTEIGIALASEDNLPRLWERIVKSAKTLTDADGCTLYRVSEDEMLHFDMVMTDSLGLIITPQADDAENRFKPLPIRMPDGSVDRRTIAARVAASGESINFSDIASEDWYDESRTHDFDYAEGYETHSILTVAVKAVDNRSVGVLQLINAKNRAGNIVPFSYEDQRVAECLAAFISLSWRLYG